jgi:glycosyltransferase involved in cell wall biosynthesis
MVGRHAGYVSTQGLILADLLREAGYEVIAVSAILNRYLRLADIIWTIIRRRREIDLLVIQTFGGPSFVVEDVVSYLGRRFGHRIIMHLHGGAMPEFMARYPQWTRRVFSRADVFVTPSEFLARAVKPYAAQIIPNVIDLSDYPYRQRQKLNPRLFWMRCFHPIYNPAMAVRALSRLRSAFPQAELVLAGQDEGMEAGIRRLAQAVGLNGAVRFPGFLNRAEKAQEGDAADIFINTSHVDNMPVTIVEACAMGLPVITTDVGGIKDLLIDGETGLLVPDDDDEAMCKAITRLLNDPALAGRLSNNGRRLAERSSWQQIRPQWEQVFAEVMRGRNAEL